MFTNIILVLNVLRFCYCDWATDWMSPVQDELDKNIPVPSRRTDDVFGLKIFDEAEDLRSIQDPQDMRIKLSKEEVYPELNVISTSNLRTKLQSTLESAKTLADTLKRQIVAVTARENLLKNIIANGRFGLSTVSVYTLGQAPRSYFIRDGFWTLCDGVLQPPTVGVASAPRCVGVEIPANPDPCVFNSIIKYETIPSRRRLEYAEDDYLCLKSNFNSTMEQYLSVPKRVVNETCGNGVIRSIEENVQLCGLRVMSDYAYYTNRQSSSLPLEYCTEKDGSCRLIAAWHVSNATIENFEFLKDEPNFKKFFVKSDTFLEQII